MALTKKQKEVFDFIKQYIHQNEYAPTQKEIKDHFNLKSFGSVQKYLKYLEDAGLLESDWNARRGLKIQESDNVHQLPSATTNIPLLGLVAAGNPIEALENPTDFIDVPTQMIKSGANYFALSVRGNSMIEDGIFENDIIVCRHQENCRQNQTVVAVIDGEATVKKFKKFDSHIELIPANSTMSPIIVNEQNFRIAGVVVALLRQYE